uniref:Hemerythrin-like domain-containing protein n=1 Tax=Chromera velia CCMP2878 TaxID=1169474 RepID=A0A0G4HVW3_9ALVE|eukprot:Cvel_8937.t1-p1 / transcript=Cvel_8937.t1 / gene=Cvel_8937 / organism=Chromera_velia_CCMP2878 / gene_product=hypothetical protein / transcript_product=hypothetical protein / location=Cvel_scaffold503:36965-52070(-) / protein_length=1293 / sequence_SO=supercontig / SO=protein_coding / is_pseudo=false
MEKGNFKFWMVTHLSTWWARVENNIELHHDHEERLFFPFLRTRINLPERMSSDHKALMSTMGKATEALKAFEGSITVKQTKTLGTDLGPAMEKLSAFRGLFADLEAIMDPHLVEEEENVLPLMMEKFTVKEVEEVEKKMVTEAYYPSRSPSTLEFKPTPRSNTSTPCATRQRSPFPFVQQNNLHVFLPPGWVAAQAAAESPRQSVLMRKIEDQSPVVLWLQKQLKRKGARQEDSSPTLTARNKSSATLTLSQSRSKTAHPAYPVHSHTSMALSDGATPRPNPFPRHPPHLSEAEDHHAPPPSSKIPHDDPSRWPLELQGVQSSAFTKGLPIPAYLQMDADANEDEGPAGASRRKTGRSVAGTPPPISGPLPPSARGKKTLKTGLGPSGDLPSPSPLPLSGKKPRARASSPGKSSPGKRTTASSKSVSPTSKPTDRKSSPLKKKTVTKPKKPTMSANPSLAPPKTSSPKKKTQKPTQSPPKRVNRMPAQKSSRPGTAISPTARPRLPGTSQRTVPAVTAIPRGKGSPPTPVPPLKSQPTKKKSEPPAPLARRRVPSPLKSKKATPVTPAPPQRASVASSKDKEGTKGTKRKAKAKKKQPLPSADRQRTRLGNLAPVLSSKHSHTNTAAGGSGKGALSSKSSNRATQGASNSSTALRPLASDDRKRTHPDSPLQPPIDAPLTYMHSLATSPHTSPRPTTARSYLAEGGGSMETPRGGKAEDEICVSARQPEKPSPLNLETAILPPLPISPVVALPSPPSTSRSRTRRTWPQNWGALGVRSPAALALFNLTVPKEAQTTTAASRLEETTQGDRKPPPKTHAHPSATGAAMKLQDLAAAFSASAGPMRSVPSGCSREDLAADNVREREKKKPGEGSRQSSAVTFAEGGESQREGGEGMGPVESPTLKALPSTPTIAGGKVRVTAQKSLGNVWPFNFNVDGPAASATPPPLRLNEAQSLGETALALASALTTARRGGGGECGRPASPHADTTSSLADRIRTQLLQDLCAAAFGEGREGGFAFPAHPASPPPRPSVSSIRRTQTPTFLESSQGNVTMQPQQGKSGGEARPSVPPQKGTTNFFVPHHFQFAPGPPQYLNRSPLPSSDPYRQTYRSFVPPSRRTIGVSPSTSNISTIQGTHPHTPVPFFQEQRVSFPLVPVSLPLRSLPSPLKAQQKPDDTATPSRPTSGKRPRSRCFPPSSCMTSDKTLVTAPPPPLHTSGNVARSTTYSPVKRHFTPTASLPRHTGWKGIGGFQAVPSVPPNPPLRSVLSGQSLLHRTGPFVPVLSLRNVPARPSANCQ